MVRVIFDAVEQDVIAPARLLDVCDDLHAPVSFSCRDGNCGTCVVDILEGADLLDEPSDHEKRTLAETHAPAGSRLACRASVTGTRGVLRLRARATAGRLAD